MAFTDHSDLFAAVHENGINATIGQLMLQRPSLFNYATLLFTQALSSQFCVPINHDVTILSGDRVTGRFTVTVQAEGAPPQVNVDLAGLEMDTGRSGEITGPFAIREGGVMGFAAGQGIGRYAVLISHTAGGGSRTVLDSRGQLPAGDLFAVTLITPGTYRATNLASQARLQITVALPRRDEPYNPARPTLVRAGDHGFDPDQAHILAGQSIVLLAETPARFLVEPSPAPHEA